MNPAGLNFLIPDKTLISSWIATPHLIILGLERISASLSGIPILFILKRHAMSLSASWISDTLLFLPFLNDGFVSVSNPSTSELINRGKTELNIWKLSTTTISPPNQESSNSLISSALILSLYTLFVIASEFFLSS